MEVTTAEAKLHTDKLDLGKKYNCLLALGSWLLAVGTPLGAMRAERSQLVKKSQPANPCPDPFSKLKPTLLDLSK